MEGWTVQHNVQITFLKSSCRVAFDENVATTIRLLYVFEAGIVAKWSQYLIEIFVNGKQKKEREREREHRQVN